MPYILTLLHTTVIANKGLMQEMEPLSKIISLMTVTLTKTLLQLDEFSFNFRRKLDFICRRRAMLQPCYDTLFTFVCYPLCFSLELSRSLIPTPWTLFPHLRLYGTLYPYALFLPLDIL